MVKYSYKIYPKLHVERTTIGLLGVDWWANHKEKMEQNIAEGKLVIYSVTPDIDDAENNYLFITQVWDSVESKEQYNLDTNNHELTTTLEELGYRIATTVEEI